MSTQQNYGMNDSFIEACLTKIRSLGYLNNLAVDPHPAFHRLQYGKASDEKLGVGLGMRLQTFIEKNTNLRL